MGFLPGLRFQKRIKILPGVTINLSKSGVSTSLGGHGATVNVGTSGRRTIALGIPGTGLSYRVPLSGTIAVGLVGIAILAAIGYFVFPDATRAALHWWQPKIF
jgi:hypothetical protein